jgi:EAL domain-containing protein (putative c-di-GMP-specific phosphodiesterase class I)/GGDEF domain-containing protein
MRTDLLRFGRLRHAPRVPRPGLVMAAAAVAGVSGGLVIASQGIWAETGPVAQSALAALLLAAAVVGACLSPREAKDAALPGLLTKTELITRVAGQTGDSCSTILCELTNLSWVGRNERGEAAELAVAEAQRRLASLLPQGACAARWSEERFLVVLPHAEDPMADLALARDLSMSLAAGPCFTSLATAVTCHAGIARGPADGTCLDELVSSAELALAGARQQGTPGYGFYSPDMAAHAERRLALQRAVREAVSGDALRLDFQPVYGMGSGELAGFEALIRLHDPELGPIPPSEFIPLAEQAGLIVEIGQWAVEEACRVAAQWPPHLVVAVNLSPAEFHSGTLITTIRRALQRHALPAYRLEVEITEGTLMTESELVLSQLKLLRDMGVGVALDDFGTGYSSLAYLCKFPFSKLKIDRSLAAALDHSASAKNVLRAIVKLGHGLGMTVTAEGIETQRQLSLLRDIGCDLGQGYLLNRPAPVGDLAAIILKNFAQSLVRRPKPGRRTAA